MKKRYPKLLGLVSLMLLLLANIGKAQFVTPYELPPLLDDSVYNLTMTREVHNFDSLAPLGDTSLNRRVHTFAFNGSVSGTNSNLGPTLIWRVGRHQTMNVTNNLQVVLGDSIRYQAPTTVHLHGAHVPAWVDGGPHGVIAPGTTRSVNFPVLDSACTLWYHPHGEDETYTQVEMGLAGMIIVKDPADGTDALLPHTYGQDDFPIIMQDHVFDTVHVHLTPTDSIWKYKLRLGIPGTAIIDTVRGQKQRTVLINGTRFPYLDVPPQNVRFRILDGSSRLSYQLGFADGNGNAIPFKMVGSDGGYLSDSARTATTFLTGPGIRNEVVFDFSAYAGQMIYLKNMNAVAPPAVITSNAEGDLAPNWMQFRVGTVPTIPIGIVPPLPHLNPYDGNNPDTTRLKRLLGSGLPNPTGFSIDNNQFEIDVVNDIVQEGDIEVWTVDNQSSIAHPFHIHDIQFFVTLVVNDLGQQVTPIPLEFLGRKDDILVQKGWQVSFVTKFDDFGRPKPFLPSSLDSAAYMYHCHLLTHEDGYYTPVNTFPGGGNNVHNRQHFGMMQQFVVWNGLFTEQAEQALTEDMVLYPNPASNQLNLKGESKQASKIRIFDLEGRTLILQDLKAFTGSTAIDISALPPGMVLVEWQSAQGTFTKKVVIR